MYKKPSSRHKNKEMERINLIPILDAIFIFIFFLLMSSNFSKIYEISSNVPIISNNSPPKDKKIPLNLTLKIESSSFELYAGIKEKLKKRISKNDKDEYNLYELRNYLIELKKKHKNENSIIFISKAEITYEVLISIMDAVRILKDTDPPIWTKNKLGDDIRVNRLFDDIIFGDIQS